MTFPKLTSLIDNKTPLSHQLPQQITIPKNQILNRFNRASISAFLLSIN